MNYINHIDSDVTNTKVQVLLSVCMFSCQEKHYRTWTIVVSFIISQLTMIFLVNTTLKDPVNTNYEFITKLEAVQYNATLSSTGCVRGTSSTGCVRSTSSTGCVRGTSSTGCVRGTSSTGCVRGTSSTGCVRGTSSTGCVRGTSREKLSSGLSLTSLYDR